MGELNFCTIFDILKTAQEQAISDLSLDLKLHLPYLFGRLLHNRAFAFLFSALRCYFLYFDAVQIGSFVFIILIPFIVYAFWHSSRMKKRLFGIYTLTPMFFIINPLRMSLGSRIDCFSLYYNVIGILGLILLIKKLAIKGKIKRS